MKNETKDEVQRLLKTVYDDCLKEDSNVRDRQLRQWRHLKLLWEGFQRVWYSEIAHDWRIWNNDNENTDQEYYDKQINVFKAYLESIIAALSVTIPPIKCFPDDANNTLDLSTAKAGDRIAKLIYRHNNAPLLWLHALFIFVTEGMVASYTYPKSDKSYGTYEEHQYGTIEEEHEITKCSECGFIHDDQILDSEGSGESGLSNNPINPTNPINRQSFEDQGLEYCPQCNSMTLPMVEQEVQTIEQILKTFTRNKTRICMEVYGGMNVKIPIHAKNQKKCGYLILSEEVDYTEVCEEHNHLHGNEKLLDYLKTVPGRDESYGPWARMSPQYVSDFPENVVTKNTVWIRPSRYNVLKDENEINELRKLYPSGVKVIFINEEFGSAESAKLDDCWTLLENPLSDYIHFQPQGEGATSVQDITNDIIALTLQTIEHGIGQTFADPAVLNFNAYSETEVLPGGIFPAKPKAGKSLNDGFHEIKTATLSGEVLPFLQQIQSLGQLVTGALPSLFGGALEGSETASQYSMSRAQALQRQQNTWKMFTIWWKLIFQKAIPKYIENIQEDEKDVQSDKYGNFVNVYIRKSELEGKIGKVELESNENLPITWGQQKDTIERLMMNPNPELMKIISTPENIPIIHDALGLPELKVPGEDSVIKQWNEIRLLLNSEPISNPDDPENPEQSSIEIDPIYDVNEIEFAVIQSWVISEEGQLAKIENELGYKNVLLHGMLHKLEMDRLAMQPQLTASAADMSGSGANPPKTAKPDMQDAPIQGELDVPQIH